MGKELCYLSSRASLPNSIHPFSIPKNCPRWSKTMILVTGSYCRNLEYRRDTKRFNFTMTYQPGNKNQKADALSRLYHPESITGPPEPILPPAIIFSPIQWSLEYGEPSSTYSESQSVSHLDIIHSPTTRLRGRYKRSVVPAVICHDYQDCWCNFLPWTKYAQNSLRQATTGLTPFQCILGYQPPLFPWSGEPLDVPAVHH